MDAKWPRSSPVSLLFALCERRERGSRFGSHRSGIGTVHVGCRGFTGPVPPPLWMSALSGKRYHARAAVDTSTAGPERAERRCLAPKAALVACRREPLDPALRRRHHPLCRHGRAGILRTATGDVPRPSPPMAARRCGRARGCARCSVAAFLARSTRRTRRRAPSTSPSSCTRPDRAPPPAPSSPSRVARATPPPGPPTGTSSCTSRCATPARCSSSTTGAPGDRLRSTAVASSRTAATTSPRWATAGSNSARPATCTAPPSPPTTSPPSSTISASTRSTCTATRTGPTSPRRSPSAIPTGSAPSPSTPPTRWRASTRGTGTSTGRWWTPSARCATATCSAPPPEATRSIAFVWWPTPSPSGR